MSWNTSQCWACDFRIAEILDIVVVGWVMDADRFWEISWIWCRLGDRLISELAPLGEIDFD